MSSHTGHNRIHSNQVESLRASSSDTQGRKLATTVDMELAAFSEIFANDATRQPRGKAVRTLFRNSSVSGKSLSVSRKFFICSKVTNTSNRGRSFIELGNLPVAGTLNQLPRMRSPIVVAPSDTIRMRCRPIEWLSLRAQTMKE
jgi:hypothetical protein